MKIPNLICRGSESSISLARIVSEDSQRALVGVILAHKSSKDS